MSRYLSIGISLRKLTFLLHMGKLSVSSVVKEVIFVIRMTASTAYAFSFR
jgi:hypothetical protein